MNNIITNLKSNPRVQKAVDITRRAASALHRFAKKAARRIRLAFRVTTAVLAACFCCLYEFCARFPESVTGRKEN